MAANPYNRRTDIPDGHALRAEQLDGMSITRLARKHACANKTIMQRLTECGYESFIPPRPQRLLPVWEDLLALSEDGCTIHEIAARFGASLKSVTTGLHRARRKAAKTRQEAERAEVALPDGWAEKGACRRHDPDLFFVATPTGEDVAKAICRHCPVKHACATYALTERIEYGVFGGLTEADRRRHPGRVTELPIYNDGEGEPEDDD